MAITLRGTKGSALTYDEMDANFGEVQTLMDKAYVSVTDYGATGGSDDAAAFSAAITASEDKTIVIPYANNTTALPSDYDNSLLVYNATSNVYLTHTTSESGLAKIKYKCQFESSHSDSLWTAFHVEAESKGSGKNGPTSADYGLTVAIHKDGYAGTTSPTAGEIDGLSIFVRQDGPKGEPSADDNSSDASGILVNAQNVEDAGYISVLEGSTSNYDRTATAIVKSIQTQIGVLDMNQTDSPSYGYVSVSTVGTNTHAFYAGEASGSSWTNILYSPNKVKIDGSGNYYAPNASWTSGAWSIVRSAAENGSTQITHRGTGALFFYAQDVSAIQFGTNGAIRWNVNSGGSFHPETNLQGNVGIATKRVSEVFSSQLDIGTTDTNGAKIMVGSGAPEGAKTANIGSLYLRLDGSTNTTLYVKESGTGNTGWVAK